MRDCSEDKERQKDGIDRYIWYDTGNLAKSLMLWRIWRTLRSGRLYTLLAWQLVMRKSELHVPRRLPVRSYSLRDIRQGKRLALALNFLQKYVVKKYFDRRRSSSPVKGIHNERPLRYREIETCKDANIAESTDIATHMYISCQLKEGCSIASLPTRS